MTLGELLTRASVWLALICATVAVLQPQTTGQSARAWWTAGAVLFVAHVGLAFGVFYRWSHARALAETARQTVAVTGVRAGAGLYLNYLFGLVWLADCAWWWCAPRNFATRLRAVTRLWRGFFFFMLVNGAVVFVHGPQRWLGVAICLALASGALRTWRRPPQPSLREPV